ncbi:hypothetical protein IID21_04825 [Patescibacteria group bacterium]|nr:hypothetical protein [Patescibacteria group bacterium]
MRCVLGAGLNKKRTMDMRALEIGRKVRHFKENLIPNRGDAEASGKLPNLHDVPRGGLIE